MHSGVIPGGPEGREGNLSPRHVGWIPFPTPLASPGMTPERDNFQFTRWRYVLLAPMLLTACQQHNAYTPGTPEYAASVVSRGYDCNLRVERGRVVAVYRGDERQRLLATNQQLAVRSYNLPRACSETERASVAAELKALVRR